MTIVPPLPDWKPKRKGAPTREERRAMGQRFIIHAREELQKGNRLQAGEKAWGAVAQHLKILGEERGWAHRSHRQVEAIGNHITREFQDVGLAQTLGKAYHVGHENFYENYRSPAEIERMIEQVERAIPVLESLADREPLPYTIKDRDDLNQLRLLTRNNQLAIGDTSPVGFSLRHHPDTHD